MKSLLFRMAMILTVSLFVHKNYAQDEPANSGCNGIIKKYCTDLSKPIPGLLLDSLVAEKSIVYGRPASAAPMFSDVIYAKDPNRKCDTLDKNVTYCVNNPQALKYSVYYPTSLNGKKIVCPLPFIVMLHAGSFFECSSIDNGGIVYLCSELAKRGFVVFDVDYRGGVLPDPRKAKNGYHYVSAQQVLGEYRASQDVRGAIRTIIWRQRNNNNGGNFSIDTNRMFIGGTSSGSVVALTTAYTERQGQIDSALSFPGKALGDLDAAYYEGDTTINFFPKIKGVLDLWGTLNIDKSFYSNPSQYFSGASNIPALIAFQGGKDSTFNIGTSYDYFSPDSTVGRKTDFNYNKVKNCLPYADSFALDNNALSEDFVTLGADAFYSILRAKGVPVEEYVDSDMGHGLDDCDTCSDNSYFHSDFGTGAQTKEEVYVYIAGRATTFFATLMNTGALNLGTTRFVDCENFRIKCAPLDNNACTVITQVSEKNLKHKR